MILKINGREQDITGCRSLAELLDGKKLNFDKIAVEHNNNIVPKQLWHKIPLSEKDKIEIVSFVGGG